MAQLNLIPGFGFVADQDQDQLNLIPGYGFSEESAGGAPPPTGTGKANPMVGPLGGPLEGPIG